MFSNIQHYSHIRSLHTPQAIMLQDTHGHQLPCNKSCYCEAYYAQCLFTACQRCCLISVVISKAVVMVLNWTELSCRPHVFKRVDNTKTEQYKLGIYFRAVVLDGMRLYK